MIRLAAAVLACALAGGSVARASQALPTPRLYVTGNYGVKAVLPGGLFYCPLPPNWVGTDHGRFMFLVKPRDCGADKTPRIALDYEHNVVEHDYGGSEDRPARTDAELRRAECPARAASVPRLRMFGRLIAGCREGRGRSVVITVSAVFGLERDDPASDTLTIALYTTRTRLAADMATFRRVLAGASICTPGWAPVFPGRPACHEHDGSWW